MMTDFYIPFRQLIAISVWAQFFCNCQGEESPLKFIVHRRLFSTEGHLPMTFAFDRQSSSTKGRLPPKVVSHQRLSSTEDNLSPKVVFHRRSSFTEGCPPMTVVVVTLTITEMKKHHKVEYVQCRVRSVNVPVFCSPAS